MVEIRRILCPIDFSEPAGHALEHAVAVARWYESAITALHVMYLTVLPQPVRIWCKPATKICYGKPYRQILEAAARDQSDLVIIGVRGRNPLDLAVFGSTTNHVVRQASCPVLTMRA